MIEKLEYKNYSIELWHDENAESPRKWSNISRMICFHKRYKLGDEHRWKDEEFESWEELRKEIAGDGEHILAIKPLNMYEHSGIAISTGTFGCDWDSMQIGWIFITKEMWIKDMQLSENFKFNDAVVKEAEKRIDSEVEIYGQWLSGDIVGFTIKEKVKSITIVTEEEIITEEEINSCGGYYGEEDAVSEAKAEIDGYINSKKEEPRVEVDNHPYSYVITHSTEHEVKPLALSFARLDGNTEEERAVEFSRGIFMNTLKNRMGEKEFKTTIKKVYKS